MTDKSKPFWVVATIRGQLPDKSWVDAGSLPFKTTEAEFSARWMKKVDADFVKAAMAGAKSITELEELAASDNAKIAEMVEAAEVAATNLKTAEDERDAAEKERDDLQAKLDKMTETAATATKPTVSKPVASQDGSAGGSQ